MNNLKVGLLSLISLSISVVIVLPLLWGLLTSIKTRRDALAQPPVLLFRPTVENYSLEGRWRALGNSLVVATCSSSLAIIVSFPLAFVLSRMDRRRGIAQTLNLLATRMMPAAMLVLPLYMVFRSLSLIDGWIGIVVIHAGVAIPIATVALKVALDEVPRALDDCCFLEGDHVVSFFRRQLIPAAVPGIAIAIMFCFVNSWNEYYFSSILTSQGYSTFTVAVAGLVTPHGTNWGQVTALASLGVLPGILAAWASSRWLSD